MLTTLKNVALCGRTRFLILLLIFPMTACNLFATKEDDCLQSTRLSFNDPDSIKVVQNLGDRGKKQWSNGEGFWLRYSVANDTGGRVSANVACEKIDGKWKRSRRLEDRAKGELFLSFQIEALEVEERLMAEFNAEREACTSRQCVDVWLAKSRFLNDPKGEKAMKRAETKATKLATDTVYLSVSDF